MDLSVVIPVYNGERHIGESLRTLQGYLAKNIPSAEVIVVDDGSTDGTRRVLESLAGPNLRVIGLDCNQGKFGALAAGMAACRGSCCLFTDADLPYDLEAIPYLTRLVTERGFHVVIGDRKLRESEYHEHLTFLRRLTSEAFSFFVGVIVTGGLFDTQCGLKGFRADVAKAIFPLLRDKGFSGDVELLYVALKYNLEVKRIPARLRRSHPSSVNILAHAPQMLWRISHLRQNWKRGYYESADLARIARQAYWE